MRRTGIVLITAGLLAATLSGCASLNPTPVVAPVRQQSLAERPVVVKVHATWCLYCMASRSDWQTLHSEFKHQAHFVVFDVTDDELEERARKRADALGLSQFFGEYSGDTGTVAVLDSRNGKVLGMVQGAGDVEEYREMMRAALLARQRESTSQ